MLIALDEERIIPSPGMSFCVACDKEVRVGVLAKNDGMCNLCAYFCNGLYEADRMAIAEAVSGILEELQERKARLSDDRLISMAYALYDSDERVSGPDDAEAFRDALRFVFGSGGDVVMQTPPVQESVAEKDGGMLPEYREFLRGMMGWLTTGDHLVVHQRKNGTTGDAILLEDIIDAYIAAVLGGDDSVTDNQWATAVHYLEWLLYGDRLRIHHEYRDAAYVDFFMSDVALDERQQFLDVLIDEYVIEQQEAMDAYI